MVDNRHGSIIAQLNVALGKLNIRSDKRTGMWNAVLTYFGKYKNNTEIQ